MYAIVDLNGKQHKVAAGDIVEIDLQDYAPGDAIEFDKVLYVSNQETAQVGTPALANVKVTAEVLGNIKGEKVVSFKYKRRKGSSRKMGHRQRYTKVKINEIVQ